MQARSLFSDKHAVPLLTLVCCTLWASSVVFVKDGYELLHVPTTDTGSVLLFAGIRFFLAGSAIVIGLSLFHREAMVPAGPEIGMVAKLACFQTIGQYSLYYIGLAHASGVTGSLMQGFAVFVGVLVSCLVFRMERLTGAKVLGCILGIIGLFVASGLGPHDFSFSFQGEGLLLIAASLGSTATVLVHKYGQTCNPILLGGWQYLTGGVVLMLMGVLLGGHLAITRPDQLAVTLWLAMVSSVAYSIWGQLLKYNDVSHVLVYKFSIPIIGVIMSLMVLGPQAGKLGLGTLVGMVLISIGIIAVQKPGLLDSVTKGGKGEAGKR